MSFLIKSFWVILTIVCVAGLIILGIKGVPSNQKVVKAEFSLPEQKKEKSHLNR